MPLMEVPFHRPDLGEREIEAVAATLRRGWITMGRETLDFEDEFKAYVGARHAVAVNSATAALHLALEAVGLAEGDEVLLPAMTFTSTAEVVCYFRARPVLVDIERETHLIDACALEALATPRTRAVIPVSYSGQPCDMDVIRAWAKKRGVTVIEDAAHALPAWHRGRMIGTLADITCFSFYATKTLTTGEGGMLVTDSAGWADRCRIMRLHGISKDAWKRYTKEGTWEYDVVGAGFKYNTTDINAALGRVQLERAGELWEKRRRIAARYDEAFRGRAGLVPYRVKEDRVSARHLYPLRLDIEALRLDREAVVAELRRRGVGTSVHFIPLYRFTYYREKFGYDARPYPNSEWVFEREMSLPIFPGMTGPEVDYVIEQVLAVVGQALR